MQGGLKVRIHPKAGVHVTNLTQQACRSFADVEHWMQMGTANRSIASTQMNATSSRAHTVVTLRFNQVTTNARGPGKHSEKSVRINLVDLAGSERTSASGASGARAQESAAINLSLTMLGKVIHALASKAANPKNRALVPYRDSKLTMLLQDALGGNSKTFMIAAISPADINYDATLSTLRYAERAKTIQNRAVVNVDPTVSLISQLKAENKRMMHELKLLQHGGGWQEETGLGGASSSIAAMKMLRAALKENEDIIEENSIEQRMSIFESLQSVAEKKAERAQAVHLSNLNESTELSHKVKYYFDEEGRTEWLVGKRPRRNAGGNGAGGDDQAPDVPLSGVGVAARHARVLRADSEQGRYELEHMEGTVTHNGGTMSAGARVQLRHADRVSFGPQHLFIFVDPASGPVIESKLPTHDEAEKEIAVAMGVTSQIAGAAGGGNGHNRHVRAVLDDAVSLLPLVVEANHYSEEWERGIQFALRSLTVPHVQPDWSELLEPRIMVRVKYGETGVARMWDEEKFARRVIAMRDRYESLEEGLETVGEADPFAEGNEPVLVGEATLSLASLAYRMELSEQLSVLDYKNAVEGSVYVNALPCTADGKVLDVNDIFVEDPQELLGSSLAFQFHIDELRGIKRSYKTVFFRYSIYRQQVETDPKIAGINVQVNHRKVFSVTVDEQFLEFLTNASVRVQLWGTQATDVGAATALNKPRAMQRHLSASVAETGLNDANQSGAQAAAQSTIRALRAEVAREKLTKRRLLRKMASVERVLKNAVDAGECTDDTFSAVQKHLLPGGKTKIKAASRVIMASRRYGLAKLAEDPKRKARIGNTLSRIKSDSTAEDASAACVVQ